MKDHQDKILLLLSNGQRMTATEIGWELWGKARRERQLNGEAVVMTHGNPQRYARPAGKVLKPLMESGLINMNWDRFRQKFVWYLRK